MKRSVNMAILGLALFSTSYLGHSEKKIESNRKPASLVIATGFVAYHYREEIKEKFEELKNRALTSIEKIRTLTEKEDNIPASVAPIAQESEASTVEEFVEKNIDTQIQKAEVEISSLQEEKKDEVNDELNQKIDIISQEKKNLENIKEELEKLVAQAKSENEDLKSKIEEKDKEIENFRCIADKNKSLESEIQKLIEENNKVALRVEELEKLSNEEHEEERYEEEEYEEEEIKEDKESKKERKVAKDEKNEEKPSALAMALAQMVAMQQQQAQQMAMMNNNPFSNIVKLDSPFQNSDNFFQQMMMLNMQKQMFESMMNKNSYGWTDMYQSPWNSSFIPGPFGGNQNSFSDSYGINPYMGQLPFPGVQQQLPANTIRGFDFNRTPAEFQVI